MKKLAYFVIAITVLLTFGLTIYYYNDLPDQVASHWNSAGEVDGYSSKAFGAFILPAVSILIAALFLIVPKAEPLQKNLKQSMSQFTGLMIMLSLFFLFGQIFILLWNTGTEINITKVFPPMIGALFIYIGSILPSIKKNYMFGIRTPWTLASDKSWQKTHELTGKLFFISGLISIAGVFANGLAMWMTLISILTASLVAVVYSYVVYKSE